MERKKPLHGKYPLRTYNAGVDRATTHQWLISSSLKGETEGFILSTQDQSISIPAYQSRILKNGADPNCRPCTETETEREREREREETVDFIVSACPTILTISKDLIESLVSYTGYYAKTSTCPTQKNGMNIHRNQ